MKRIVPIFFKLQQKNGIQNCKEVREVNAKAKG